MQSKVRVHTAPPISWRMAGVEKTEANHMSINKICGIICTLSFLLTGISFQFSNAGIPHRVMCRVEAGSIYNNATSLKAEYGQREHYRTDHFHGFHGNSSLAHHYTPGYFKLFLMYMDQPTFLR